MVFYRKYRPQTIDQLDSAKVRETLKSVLLSKEISHAFLFTGPKGLGKTSTARIVAKVVNCEHLKGKETIPCNECDSCVSITAGTNIDVLEIDGASNRGIDEIRDLREKVRLAPSMSRKKVYIIDEVHMLTTEAFNALLKTIEEPPSHVMFLFCTTEPQKVPATILSRCFHISFAPATEEELVRSLKRIVIGENLQITDEALYLIANLAEGGFRDGTKILEEMSLVSGGKEITKELIEAKYKVSSIKYKVSEMLAELKNRNTKKALQIVLQLVEEGSDMKYVMTHIIESLHAMLLMQAGIKNQLSPVNSQLFNLNEISQLVSLFSNAYVEMKYAVVAQLPLELAIIQWGMEESAPIAAQPVKPTMQEMQHKEKNMKVQSILRPTSSTAQPKPISLHEQKEIHENTDAAKILMENLIYKTKEFNHSVAAVLRGCKVKLYENNKLVLETAYKFHKERLDEQKTKDVLEKAMKEITGNMVGIVIELRK